MSELKTSEYVVAFIDILGASAMIKDKPDETLNIVHKRYEQSIEFYEQAFGKLKSALNVRIFSDNIVLFCDCKKIPAIEALKIITMLTSIIQINFLNDDILLRGGITKGDFFADDIMIWGNALVKAYDIESNIAIYPRIVIDPDLIADTKLFLTQDEKTAKFKKEYISQDRDGLCFVNYLHITKALKKPEFGCLLFSEKAFDMVVKNTNNTKVVQKMNWHLQYINDYRLNQEDNSKCEK